MNFATVSLSDNDMALSVGCGDVWLTESSVDDPSARNLSLLVVR